MLGWGCTCWIFLWRITDRTVSLRSINVRLTLSPQILFLTTLTFSWLLATVIGNRVGFLIQSDQIGDTPLLPDTHTNTHTYHPFLKYSGKHLVLPELMCKSRLPIVATVLLSDSLRLAGADKAPAEWPWGGVSHNFPTEVNSRDRPPCPSKCNFGAVSAVLSFPRRRVALNLIWKTRRQRRLLTVARAPLALHFKHIVKSFMRSKWIYRTSHHNRLTVVIIRLWQRLHTDEPLRKCQRKLYSQWQRGRSETQELKNHSACVTYTGGKIAGITITTYWVPTKEHRFKILFKS